MHPYVELGYVMLKVVSGLPPGGLSGVGGLGHVTEFLHTGQFLGLPLCKLGQVSLVLPKFLHYRNV